MADIHDYLLSAIGMAAAKQTLGERIEWFLHTGPVTNFESIKARGLRVAKPECSVEPQVTQHLGLDKIVCFQPFPPLALALGREGKKFKVAISFASLPDRIGLDWSYGGVWAHALSLVRPPDLMSAEESFVATIKQFGSVVAYDPVPASCLRVLTRNAITSSSPWEWSLLTNVDAADVALFP
jgi:hypothetical protein